jgi:Tol biopolymer transport system component
VADLAERAEQRLDLMRVRGATLAAALGGVALLAVPAGVGEASFPGGNGKLAGVFSQEDRDSSALVLQLFSPSGQRLGRVARCIENTTGGGGTTGRCPRDPAFSADGSRLAFTSNGRLAVASSDGSGVTLLPQLTARDADPAWSPGGHRLVFTGRQAGRRNLYLVDPDGSNLSRLTTGGARAPAWSRRGQIAFAARGRIWRLGSSGRVLLARGDHPDWSPSGRTVAYHFRGNAYRVSGRGGTPPRLLVRRAREPVFSPNGRRVIFLRVRRADRNAGTESVFVRGVRGGRARLLRAGGELPIGSTFRSWADLAWQPRP